MKKILCIILSAAMLVCLAACGSGSTTTTAAPAAETTGAAETAAPATDEPIPITIGFCWQDTVSEVFALYKSIVDQTVEQINAEGVYDVTVIHTDALGDTAQQISDAETLISMQCDVVCFSACDEEASEAAVAKFDEAGIPVVNSFKMTSAPVTCKVYSMDHYYVGQKYAEWLDNWMNENPDVHLNIAFVSGNPANPDTLKRCTAFEDEFVSKWEPTGRITYLGSQYGNQSAEDAIPIAEDWLQSNPEINCFVSSSDMMTYSIYNVCKAAGRDDILYVTGDATQSVLEEIIAGNLPMTIGMDKESIIKCVVDTCIKVSQGEEVPEEINSLTEAVVTLDTPEAAKEFYDKYY